MSVKTIVYDGTRYAEIEMEPILNEGKETGHYKDLNRKWITINGIFDDEKVTSEVIDFINNLHEVCDSDYYLLESQMHYTDLNLDRAYLFSSYSLSPEYSSLGEAVIEQMIEMGWLVDKYEIKKLTYKNKEIEIIFFHYKADNLQVSYWDEAYLFPVDATTFKG